MFLLFFVLISRSPFEKILFLLLVYFFLRLFIFALVVSSAVGINTVLGGSSFIKWEIYSVFFIIFLNIFAFLLFIFLVISFFYVSCYFISVTLVIFLYYLFVLRRKVLPFFILYKRLILKINFMGC